MNNGYKDNMLMSDYERLYTECHDKIIEIMRNELGYNDFSDAQTFDSQMFGLILNHATHLVKMKNVNSGGFYASNYESWDFDDFFLILLSINSAIKNSVVKFGNGLIKNIMEKIEND